jgi:hypothetical protein
VVIQTRISRAAGNELAFAAAQIDAERELKPDHWAKWSAVRRPARYEIAPQADEWSSVLGFVPDEESYLEFGYMIVEDLGHSVVVCRVLVDRREQGSVVRIEWYPTNLDSRKRPH